MSGGSQSDIVVTLRNPLDYSDQFKYYIVPNDTPLANDWVAALKLLLINNNMLEKNFCFMGFPTTARNLELLCKELNSAIYTINMFNSSLAWINSGLKSYFIEEYFVPDAVRFGAEYPVATRFDDTQENRLQLITNIGLIEKKEILNKLHNHFEHLQGTVNNLSPYYIAADYETKYAIRQLNVICHEMETLILSQQKQMHVPEWTRPSQITTWLHATRYHLNDEHRVLFLENGYDRRLGQVYMHWAQIGKTLFEVFRDEDAPELTDTVCEAITHLEYYSGEFDIEWAADMVYGDPMTPWHTEQQDKFKTWLNSNGLDPQDTKLSLGYLPVAQVDLIRSFGTDDKFAIWDKLSKYLDIYKIEINGISAVFDYCWSDANYKQMQIDMMKPGYDYSSSRG
jgi:hypothetical protein